MLHRFKHYYEQLPDYPFFDTYRENQICIGKPVLFSAPEGMLRGTAAGVDADFRLLAVTADGQTFALDRGDVTIL